MSPKPREAPVDYDRPIKVICIGAGMSGILCGIRFQQKIPNLNLIIYEKNNDVGGVWLENRYPGVTCGTSSMIACYNSDALLIEQFLTSSIWSRRSLALLPVHIRQ